MVDQVEDNDDLAYFENLKNNFSPFAQIELIKEKYFKKKMREIMFKARNIELSKKVNYLDRLVIDMKEEKGNIIYK
jgi:hypothetical protein